MARTSSSAGQRGRPPGELGDERPRDARGQQGVAGGDDPDGVEQVLRWRVLQEEAAGPGPQGVVDVLVEVEGGEDEDPGLRPLGRAHDLPGRLDPVHLRHPDVHEDDVGPHLPHQTDRLDPVGGLPEHLEIGRGVDEDPETGPHERLIVDDDDTDHDEVRQSRGKLATTRKPPPDRAPPTATRRTARPARACR